MGNYFRLFVVGLFIAGSFAFVLPAKAFYFELPQILKNAVQSLKANAIAQESSEVRPAETPAPAVEPMPRLDPTPPMESDKRIVPSIEPPRPQEPKYNPEQPSPGGDSENNKNPGQTCRVNGEERPGSCDQYNNSQPGMGSEGNEGQKNFQPQDGQQGDQQNNERMLKDMKRGANDVARQLKQFEAIVTKFEKKGVVIKAETKTKIEELRAMITKYQSATSAEEIQGVDMNEMWDKMRDLEEERRNLEQMDNIMREMRRIESNVKMFEKQIQKLEKQKLAVPATVTEALEKVKTAIAEIKAGNMENAEEIFDLVRELDENRNQLEMLARWPQTAKEMDKQVKRLETELKKAKTTVARLLKKGIDLSSIYAEFESAVLKMREVRDSAKAMIQEDAESAFDMVQNDFFGQMEDVMEYQRIIMTMSNFGQFQANFNKEITQANNQIKALKKKKIDTVELEEMLARAKEQGAGTKALLNTKPIDVEAIVDALSEMENIGQEFDEKVAELTGVDADMPWEKGTQQFQRVEVSPNLDKWIPQKTQEAKPEVKSVE